MARSTRPTERAESPLIDQIAALQYDFWASWMRFMISGCGERRADGSIVIPAAKLEQWQRQMAGYELADKTAVREQAVKVLQLIQPEVANGNSAG